MGWKRRGVLAAAGAYVLGAGCFGKDEDTDDGYDHPDRPTPETPVIEPQERPTATETEATTEAPGTEDDTPTDTETPEPAETTTPEPPEQHTADELENSIWWAENSLNRSMPLYNNEYAIPAPILSAHSGVVAASAPAGDEYSVTVSTDTYSGGRYDDIGAYLDGSADARQQLEDELGHGLAYMITSTMKLSRAPDLDDYLPDEQPEGPPVITDASYSINGNNGGKVGIDLGTDELSSAAAIIETTDGTVDTWNRLYQDIIQDNMYVNP